MIKLTKEEFDKVCIISKTTIKPQFAFPIIESIVKAALEPMDTTADHSAEIDCIINNITNNQDDFFNELNGLKALRSGLYNDIHVLYTVNKNFKYDNLLNMFLSKMNENDVKWFLYGTIINARNERNTEILSAFYEVAELYRIECILRASPNQLYNNAKAYINEELLETELVNVYTTVNYIIKKRNVYDEDVQKSHKHGRELEEMIINEYCKRIDAMIELGKLHAEYFERQVQAEKSKMMNATCKPCTWPFK